MKINSTKFKDLKIIKSPVHIDRRGFFRETFKNKLVKKNLVFGCSSKSRKNVLRGLHLQNKKSQGKFITVLKGEIFDVAVDLRKNSKTFGKYFSIYLSEKENKSLLIPAGFAHGFCTLTNDVVLHYKCSKYRHSQSETGILWNDSELSIAWPKRKLTISEKDKNNISFRDFKDLI